MLTSVEDAPVFTVAAALEADELERRADMLENDDQLRARLVAALEAGRAPKEASPHIELQIYDGFWPKTDEFLMESFHAVPWEKRLAIAENFQDPRLKMIAMHLIHIERPDLLNPLIGAAHDRTRARRVLGLDGEMPWQTLPKAIAQVEAMLADCEGSHRDHLQEHCDHLRDWLDRAQAIVAGTDLPALSA